MSKHTCLIFLDYDGVLNSRASELVYGSKDIYDPVCVGLIKALVEAANAKIVIASHHRFDRTVEESIARMREQGGKKLSKAIVGELTCVRGIAQGVLVQDYLKENGNMPYLIIDDEPSRYLAGQPIVAPDAREGFGFVNFLAACEVLGVDFDPNGGV
jgi:hypothetical protein